MPVTSQPEFGAFFIGWSESTHSRFDGDQPDPTSQFVFSHPSISLM